MKRYLSLLLATAVAALTLAVMAVPASAAVPGRSFTETGCEEYTDSVARLYTAGLGRAPEQGGFEFWVDEYMAGRHSLRSMAVFFTQSPEFARSFGNPSNLDFVKIMYRNVLGREGEAGGIAFWTAELDSGNRDRALVLLNFAESPENITRSGTTMPALGVFNAGLPAGAWSCANTTPATPEPPAPTQPTISQQNAIAKAKSYLRFSSFSRSGLIDQLEYEKFSTADATYAVDSLDIDFNAQAVKKAASYLNYTAFSRLGLISQLEYEGFTTAQAIHGTDAQGTDYNRQAELKAASYLRFMSFSCQGLIDQLEYEEFTTAQATHGARSTGLCG